MSAVSFEVVGMDSAAYRKSVELRRTILRLPLGLDFSEQDLEPDVRAVHLIGLMDNEVVAVLLLEPKDGGSIKMRQVAVCSNLQGTGIGSELVKAAESEASKRGFKQIILNARETAVPFYLKLNYEIEGEPFEEVSIPHRRMVKLL